MRISGLSTLIPQSTVPSAGQFQISNTIKNLNKEAGPITYASYILGCELLATAATGGIGSVPALQACLYSCIPTLAPWCP